MHLSESFTTLRNRKIRYYDSADFWRRVSLIILLSIKNKYEQRHQISTGYVYFCSKHPKKTFLGIFSTLTTLYFFSGSIRLFLFSADFCFRILRRYPRGYLLSFNYKDGFEPSRNIRCCALLLWVQDLRTYSPRYSWPAITSDSGFMRSSCRPQSKLAPTL